MQQTGGLPGKRIGAYTSRWITATYAPNAAGDISEYLSMFQINHVTAPMDSPKHEESISGVT
jgi:hypothetical protein